MEKSTDFCADNKDISNKIGKLLKLSFRLYFLCPFEMWVEISSNTKRTNNVSESFHVNFNAHFCTTDPTVFVFLSRGQHTVVLYVVTLLY